MKYTPLSYEINLREGVVIDVGSLCLALCGLQDKRDARGLRYALVTVLLLILLAKMACEVKSQDKIRNLAKHSHRRWTSTKTTYSLRSVVRLDGHCENNLPTKR